jgi:hypothetical protein
VGGDSGECRLYGQKKICLFLFGAAYFDLCRAILIFQPVYFNLCLSPLVQGGAGTKEANPSLGTSHLTKVMLCRMFAVIQRFVSLEGNLWPGIGSADMGLGKPG